MGKEKFASRNIDTDTKILSEKIFQHDEYDLLLEKWFWDGIKAKSLIFLTEQVSSLKDSQLESLARKILDISTEQQATLTRSEHFSYFNFDFRS